jgi:hypothetical protein
MPPRKKKTDYAALQSPLSRIPGLPLVAVRDLLDIGIGHVDELHGRAPASLLAEVRKLRPETPTDRLACFRLAVYYAETPQPDPALLDPWKWRMADG